MGQEDVAVNMESDKYMEEFFEQVCMKVNLEFTIPQDYYVME